MDPNLPTGGPQPGWVPPPDPSSGAPQGGWGSHPGPTGPWPPQPGAWGGPQHPWAPQPKRKRFGWGSLIAAFVVGGIVSAIVTIVGLVVLAVAGGLPDAIAGTHPPAEEGVPAAKVGDCLQDEPASAVVVDRSDVVDCDELHGSEVAAVLETPGDDGKPDDETLRAFTDDACSLAFQGYVGSDPMESQFDYAAIVPSDAAWEEGDRTIWCLVDTRSLEANEGTVRGSGR